MISERVPRRSCGSPHSSCSLERPLQGTPRTPSRRALLGPSGTPPRSATSRQWLIDAAWRLIDIPGGGAGYLDKPLPGCYPRQRLIDAGYLRQRRLHGLYRRVCCLAGLAASGSGSVPAAYIKGLLLRLGTGGDGRVGGLTESCLWVYPTLGLPSVR